MIKKQHKKTLEHLRSVELETIEVMSRKRKIILIKVLVHRFKKDTQKKV